jgi:hypothetical protein
VEELEVLKGMVMMELEDQEVVTEDLWEVGQVLVFNQVI